MNIINKILDFLSPIVTQKYWVFILSGILAISLFCLIMYFHKNAIVSTLIKKNNDRVILRQKEIRQNLKRKEESRFTRKLREGLMYSGWIKKFSFLTPENFIMLLLGLFAGTFIISLIISHKLVMSVLIAFCAIGLVLIDEGLQSFINYKKTDKCIVEFLNLLGNYSSQNTEITDVFSKIYLRVEEPLQSALKDCIIEVETLGTDSALTNLSNKIEHPKFKEIIQNIRISIKYSDSFKSVVDINNDNLSDYVKLKKEAEQLAIGNFVTLCISLFIGVLIIYFCGKLVEVNMLTYILSTTSAQIECFISLFALAYAGWQIYKISR